MRNTHTGTHARTTRHTTISLGTGVAPRAAVGCCTGREEEETMVSLNEQGVDVPASKHDPIHLPAPPDRKQQQPPTTTTKHPWRRGWRRARGGSLHRKRRRGDHGLPQRTGTRRAREQARSTTPARAPRPETTNHRAPRRPTTTTGKISRYFKGSRQFGPSSPNV